MGPINSHLIELFDSMQQGFCHDKFYFYLFYCVKANVLHVLNSSLSHFGPNRLSLSKKIKSKLKTLVCLV